MSAVVEHTPTFEEQVEDFAAVMDAAGSERAALFGTIDAGTIALTFAAEHPERTRAVIAFETPPGSHGPGRTTTGSSRGS